MNKILIQLVWLMSISLQAQESAVEHQRIYVHENFSTIRNNVWPVERRRPLMDEYSELLRQVRGYWTSLSPSTVYKSPRAPEQNLFFKEHGFVIQGLGTQAAFERFTKVQPEPETVVAVIGQGVAYLPDFYGKFFINAKEVPNDGIDNDRNGYIDDISGWSFVGNKNYKAIFNLKAEYGSSVIHKIEHGVMNSKTQNFPHFAGQDFYGNHANSIFINDAKEEYKTYARLLVKRSTLFSQNRDLYPDDLAQYYRNQYLTRRDCGPYAQSLPALQIKCFPYAANDLREKTVQDDVEKWLEKGYGNNDPFYRGIDNDVVSALLGKGIIQVDGKSTLTRLGVASQTKTKILPIRILGETGDYRDKDLANAVQYAVQMGAHIIILPLSKKLSPKPEQVSLVLDNALNKKILILHAPGEAQEESAYGLNLNQLTGRFFPHRLFLKSPHNFLRIFPYGPSTEERYLISKKAHFGNWAMDYMAPGEQMLTLCPNFIQGNCLSARSTRIAAGTFAGAVAFIRSYVSEQYSVPEIAHALGKSGKDIANYRVKLIRDNADLLPLEVKSEKEYDQKMEKLLKEKEKIKSVISDGFDIMYMRELVRNPFLLDVEQTISTLKRSK